MLIFAKEDRMFDSMEIIRLRVLLAFYQMDEESRSVMNISRMLGQEHYVISRVISGLEKEGLIERETPRKPVLTAKGKEKAEKYSKRMELTLNHLLYEGVSMENARNDAYNWALNNTDETMTVIANAEEKYRVKYELRDKKNFSGKDLCKKMNDGTYRFPFIIYKEQIEKKQNTNISMANAGFEHPCELVVRDGVGMIHMRALTMSANSRKSGMLMQGKVQTVKYNYNNVFIDAEKNGDAICFPAECLNFLNIGSGVDQILHGSVCLKMKCSVGVIHMPESVAIFTILI